MRVKDFLRASKTVIDSGKWNGGKMPSSLFPLKKGKRRTFCLGGAFRWRALRFSALGHNFRAIVAYRTDVEEYRAYIGMDAKDGDTILFFEWAYHGTHEGWHLHTSCDPITNLPSGVMRSRALKRFPNGFRNHRRKNLVVEGSEMSDSTAYHIFAKRVRLPFESLDLFEKAALQ